MQLIYVQKVLFLLSKILYVNISMFFFTSIYFTYYFIPIFFNKYYYQFKFLITLNLHIMEGSHNMNNIPHYTKVLVKKETFFTFV